MWKTVENLRIPKTFFRRHVDVHNGEGVMWTGWSKTRFSCGRHKWMTPNMLKLYLIRNINVIGQNTEHCLQLAERKCTKHAFKKTQNISCNVAFVPLPISSDTYSFSLPLQNLTKVTYKIFICHRILFIFVKHPICKLHFV